jgi:hypothetical protein
VLLNKKLFLLYSSRRGEATSEMLEPAALAIKPAWLCCGMSAARRLPHLLSARRNRFGCLSRVFLSSCLKQQRGCKCEIATTCGLTALGRKNRCAVRPLNASAQATDSDSHQWGTRQQHAPTQTIHSGHPPTNRPRTHSPLGRGRRRSTTNTAVIKIAVAENGRVKNSCVCVVVEREMRFSGRTSAQPMHKTFMQHARRANLMCAGRTRATRSCLLRA